MFAAIKMTVLLALICGMFPLEPAAAAVAASAAQEPPPWSTAGANPQRTSWTAEEVRGRLFPDWYRPIEPYIPAKVQIIAAHGLLYVSTAAGLYALHADTGEIAWIYPTDLPLGHSPTVHAGRVYVGGLDHKIHAIDALSGAGFWSFKAAPDGIGAGFSTNPLVLDLDGQTMIYAGNRDGWMYAVRDDGAQPTLIWSFETGGPILFSAAYQDGKVFFASNDSYAYALDARTGQQVWKSAKLPSAGFHSWWPTIAGNVVILPGTRPYRRHVPPQDDWSTVTLTNSDPGYDLPMGPTLPDGTMDATQAFEYFESYPWRRVYYLLDVQTGQEITFDLDHDGLAEYAPFMKAGTHSGTVYPAVAAADDTIFTFNKYAAQKYDQGPAGWTLGAQSIIPTTDLTAPDEPLAFSIGGDVVYWNQCCDRSAGAYALDTEEKWTYFSYDLDDLCPGYDAMVMGTYEENAVQVYGGWNGIYGSHGDQNPPIPYNGRVYMHRGNAVIAWSSDGGRQSLPLVEEGSTHKSPVAADRKALERRLEQEVQKILEAGHLRPALGLHGEICGAGRDRIWDNLCDYWHSPVDTILVLSLAVPHLPSEMQLQVKEVLRTEIDDYMPYTHVGWRVGAGREAFDLPPEIQMDLANWPATKWSTYSFDGWTGPEEQWVPHTLYALWKYAEMLGDQQAARQLFDEYAERLWSPPADDVLAEVPFAHNAWIAGYWGYLELERLAGYPETSGVRAELDRLLALRLSNFEKDNPWGPDAHEWAQSLAVARNFAFLTPELGAYLHDHLYSEVEAALAEYEQVAPYWFVTLFEASYNENIIQHLYDYHALFAAKAFVFQEPAEELVKYLDVPAFARGDLFYIRNLIAAIETPPLVTKTTTRVPSYQGDPVTYTLSFMGLDKHLTLIDTVPDGLGAAVSFYADGTDIQPTYDSERHRVTWADTPPDGQLVVLGYTVTIVTAEPEVLVNSAELYGPEGAVSIATASIIANPYVAFLPAIRGKARQP